MPSALPGPLTRLRRNRLLLIGVLLSSGVAISTSGIADRASVRIQGDVDANWRGAYDILVRPQGGRLDLESTNGLVEPNFLGFSGAGGISLEGLDSIRHIDGVQLAAPVAVVGYVSYVITAPIVHVSALPGQPTLYEIRVDEYSTDGLSDIPIQSSIGHIVLGPADLQSPGLEFRTDLRDLSWSTEGVDITMPSLPAIVSPLIGVDPVAEQLLLGPPGAFLTPLAEIDGRPSLTVESLDRTSIPEQFEIDILTFAALLEEGGEVTKRPVVPVVVSDRLYGALSLRLTVTQLGERLTSQPTQDEFSAMLPAASEASRQEVGATSITVDEDFHPFQAPSLVLLWPGSSPPSGTMVGANVDRSFALVLASRPAYSQHTQEGSLTFEIASTGLVDPAGRPFGSPAPPSGRGTPTVIYPEPAYRDLEAMPLALAEGFVPASALDRPFHFAPFGTFDLAHIEVPNNPLNYVPLGAYDPPAAALVTNPDGTVMDPRPMRPTLNPAGLLQVPPLAITDLAGATTLRGDNPIDAVRIRVAGLTGYGAADRSKVETVAAAIAELGLDVDIVAGSSPQEVQIYVPDYVQAGSELTDLGYVREGWTTLGAAERVEVGLEAINVALLLLAIATAVVFTIGLEVLGLQRRGQEIAILRALGWRTHRITWWVVGEAGISATAVLAFGALGSALAGGGVLPLAVATGLAGVLLLSSYIGAFVAARGSNAVAAGDVRPVSSLARAVRVRGAWTHAARQVAAYPSTSLSLISAATIAGLSFAVGVAMAAEAIRATGPTALGIELLERLRPYQIGLVSISLLGGIILAAACVSVDRRARSRDDRLAAAIGWSARESRGPVVRRALILAAPGSVAAGTAAAAVGLFVGLQPGPGLVGAAGIAVFVLLVGPAVFLPHRSSLERG